MIVQVSQSYIGINHNILHPPSAQSTLSLTLNECHSTVDSILSTYFPREASYSFVCFLKRVGRPGFVQSEGTTGGVGAPAKDDFESAGRDFLGVNSCLGVACCLPPTDKSGLLSLLLLGTSSSFEILGGLNNSSEAGPRCSFEGDEQGCSF